MTNARDGAHTRYVASAAALEALCAALAGSPWLALDTEFIRDSSYYPALCLAQVANEEIVACVDPLAIADLGPLLKVLYSPDTVLVMHAARQDLEVLYGIAGSVPARLFDTQIAAAVLGHGDQVGYAALVQAMLGVALDKSHTRADWARRPLEPEQLRYAEDDVRYLGKIYERQLEALRQRGRLQWLEEDFQALCDPGLYTSVPEDAWERLRGASRLRGAQLAVLQELAAWRERRAQDLDKPRRWVLRDDLLVELARRMPASLAALKRLRDLPEATLRHHGAELLGIIQLAQQSAPASWPTLATNPTLGPGQEAMVDALMALVRMRAAEHGIGVPTLAKRGDLERLVAGDPASPVLHGWRGALLGEELQALLAGRLSLRLSRQGLICEP